MFRFVFVVFCICMTVCVESSDKRGAHEPYVISALSRYDEGTQTDLTCSEVPKVNGRRTWHNWGDLTEIEELEGQVAAYERQLRQRSHGRGHSRSSITPSVTTTASESVSDAERASPSTQVSPSVAGSALVVASKKLHASREPLRDAVTGEIIPSARRKPVQQAAHNTADCSRHVTLLEEACAKMKVLAGELQCWQKYAQELQQQVDGFKVERGRWLRHVPSRGGMSTDALDFYAYFSGHRQEVDDLRNQLSKKEAALQKAVKDRKDRDRSELKYVNLEERNRQLQAQVDKLGMYVTGWQEKYSAEVQSKDELLQRNQELANALERSNKETRELWGRYTRLQQLGKDFIEHKYMPLLAYNKGLAILVMKLGGVDRMSSTFIGKRPLSLPSCESSGRVGPLSESVIEDNSSL